MNKNNLLNNEITNLGLSYHLLQDFKSFEDIICHIQLLSKKYILHKPLLTLDNSFQTHYSSFYSGIEHGIFEQDFNLHNKERLNFQINSLSTLVEYVSFKDSIKKNFTINEYELSILTEININPIKFLDEKLELYWVPVKEPFQILSVLPVGYFYNDLNLIQNASLSKHFYLNYGYELTGIGNNLLCFLKTNELTNSQLISIIKDIQKLYNCTFDQKSINDLTQLMKNNPWFFIRYSGSFSF